MRKRIALLAVLASTVATADDTKPAVTFYGFALPVVHVASGAVESFNQPNMGGYTAAGNPVLAAAPDAARATFNVVQSRFGLVAHAAPGTSATFEFDFVDYAKSSPTTASVPRLRRAFLDYQPTEHLLLRMGQEWDLPSPLSPHTFNFLGHHFQGGDIAFMRIQAQALYRDGAWEHGFALGLPGNNNGPADNGLELDLVPTVAFRETYWFAEKARAGVSLLVTGIRPATTTAEHLFAGAVNAFLETAVSDSTEIRTEAYLGQNTNNLGMHGLSFGSLAAKAVREAGAYVSFRTKLGTSYAVFGSLGGAWVLDSGDVAAAYSTSGGTAKLAGTGPGIVSNWTARVGGEWLWNEKAKLFTEIASLATTHRLLAADLAKYDPHRTAVVVSLGSQVSF